MVNTI